MTYSKPLVRGLGRWIFKGIGNTLWLGEDRACGLMSGIAGQFLHGDQFVAGGREHARLRLSRMNKAVLSLSCQGGVPPSQNQPVLYQGFALPSHQLTWKCNKALFKSKVVFLQGSMLAGGRVDYRHRSPVGPFTARWSLMAVSSWSQRRAGRGQLHMVWWVVDSLP